MLWKERSRARQGAAIAIFVVLCAGYLVRDARLERKWDDFTRMYREVVTAIVEESDAFPGVTTLAVEGSPLALSLSRRRDRARAARAGRRSR